MKQTKPFGRAFIPNLQLLDEPSSAEEAAPVSAAKQAPADREVHTELFDLAGASRPTPPVPQASPLRKMLRDAAMLLGVPVLLLTAYVGMRDSMILAGFLDQVSTEETVMLCKDGKMVYRDEFSVVDRLLNRGNFVCTDWRVQRGFLTRARHS
jgi:hypothetical protein